MPSFSKLPLIPSIFIIPVALFSNGFSSPLRNVTFALKKKLPALPFFVYSIKEDYYFPDLRVSILSYPSPIFESDIPSLKTSTFIVVSSFTQNTKTSPQIGFIPQSYDKKKMSYICLFY